MLNLTSVDGIQMARDVNFGLWYDLRNPQPWAVPFEQLYAAVLEQISWAESIGYNSVWLTEHHFIEDGYTPSPLVFASAIAARTRHMRIGTNLMLLPLYDPLRIAEDAAAVSLVSGGRFDLGVGIGYRQTEFDYFDRKLSHRPSLMEEGIAILRQAFSGEPVNFQGKRFNIDNIAVSPVPEHTPRLLMGGLAPVAIERAARIGDGFLSTGGIGQQEYVDALVSVGKGADGGVICAGHWGVVAEDPERELERLGPHILYQANEYIKWGAFGPPGTVPEFPDAASAAENGLYEFWDVDTAVEQLSTMLAQFPQVVDIHFWAQFPGESIESGSRRLELLASEVLPRVRATL